MPLFGGPKLSAEQRDDAWRYYEAALAVAALQDREADRYNRTLMVHMNTMDRRDSMEAMLAASMRLSLASHELVGRHSQISPLPQLDLIAADYAIWHGVYLAYSEWADAQHDAVVTLARGGTPLGDRVKRLLDASEGVRRKAEGQTKDLLRALKVNSADVQRMTAVMHSHLAWEPPADE